MILPPPVALGLPPHFLKWRRYQEEAIFAAAEDDHRFHLAVVPTGLGKSLMYTALAHLLKARTLILTRTKALQHQLMLDFESLGMRSISGMSNYRCLAIEPGGEHFGLSRRGGFAACDEGPCRAGAFCSLMNGGCLYYDQLVRATEARLVVSNYDYWMYQSRYSRGLGEFDLLILDEAHDAPQALSQFLTVEIEPWEAERIGAHLPASEWTMQTWANWGTDHHATTSARVDLLSTRIRELTKAGRGVTRSMVDESHTLKRIATKLDQVKQANAEWCAYKGTRGSWYLTPVWPAGYGEEYLFRGTKKVVLTSATITSKTADYLGIDPEERSLREYPSIFPKAHRPVYQIPTVRCRRGMTENEVKLWLAQIDNILHQRPDVKGIIHTVSYDRARTIALNSEYQDRLIIHSPGNVRAAIERYKRETRPFVLVSPVVMTGYDFPGDECRFQIIAKIPFPDTSDPVLQARQERDKDYTNYMAMQSLVQACGRSTRSEDDFSECFIIDDQFRWIRRKLKHLIPRWFLDTVETRPTIPAAPPRRLP